MKSKDYRKAFALTAIYLMISITFFSANALAFNYTVSGEDRINGWRKAEDITIFDVYADANVSILMADGNSKSMICNNNHCEYFLDKDTTSLDEIPLVLRHELANPMEYPLTLRVDRIAPSISVNINTENKLLKVDYSINEGSTICSGIKYINYNVGSESDQIDINGTKCVYNGTLTFNNSGIYEDNFSISFSATDKLGNTNTSITSIELDFQDPQINDELVLMKNGQQQDILSKNTNTTVEVIVYVNDANLKSVYGDLSSLNPNPAVNMPLKNKQAVCTLQAENNYKCVFSGISIKPVEDSISIIVNAEDDQSNIASKKVSKVLTLMSDPGQPTYIGPFKNHCNADLSKCYTSTGSQNFILEINAGSNYNNTIIRYGTGETNNPAFCLFKEDKWVCTSVPYSVTDTGQLKVYIAYPSADSYGNQVSYIERSVIIDSVKPLITENITSSLPNCSVSGDTLKLSFTAKESLSDELRTYVNTSGFTSNELSNGTCERMSGDEWLCSIEITDFVSTYVPKTTRQVIVEDLAGNKGSKPFIFEVCEQNPNAPPNLITSIKQKKDIIVDRRTASLLPVKTYVPLDITLKKGTILGITVDNCIGEDENAQSFLDSGHYFIDNTLVLYIGYSGASIPSGEFEINCTINARVRDGKKIYQKLEVETLILKAESYNNPLGTLDVAVNKKIRETKGSIKDLNSEIETRESVATILGTLCDIANLVAKINSLLQTVKAIVYAACMAMQAFGLGGPAQATWAWVGGTLDWFDVNIAQWIWPTSILKANLSGVLIKYGCMLYTCQHYKVSGLYTLYADTKALIGEGNRLSKIKLELKDNIDPKGEFIDSTTFKESGENGATYKKTVDANGNEVWKGDNGDMMIYDPNKNEWTYDVDETVKKEWQNKQNEKASTTNQQGSNQQSSNTQQNTQQTTGEDKVFENKKYEWVMTTSDNKEVYRFVDDKGVVSMYKEENGKMVPLVDQTTAAPPTKPGTRTGGDGTGSGDGTKKIKVDGMELTETEISGGGKLWKGTDENYYIVENGKKTLISLSSLSSLLQPVNKENKYTWLGNKKSDGKYYNWWYDPVDKQYYKQEYGDKINYVKASKPVFNSFEQISVQGVYELWKSEGKKGWLGNSEVGSFWSDEEHYYINLYGRVSDGVYVIEGYKHDESQETKPVFIAKNSAELGKNVKSLNKVTNKVIYDISGNSILDITGRGTGGEGDGPISTSSSTPKPTQTNPQTNTNDKSWSPDFDAANDAYQDHNLKFYSTLESEDWIVNPYRSVYWDDLCAPAVLYNLQKERQIKCKYLSCLQSQTTAGLPSYVCDRDYGMESCLYLDSAQWHLTGGAFWRTVGPGLLKSGFSFLMGMAPYLIYDWQCDAYQLSNLAGKPADLATGPYEVLCGFAGVALQAKEIDQIFRGDYWSGMFTSDIPRDPAEIKDYCAGVDLNE